MLQAIRRRLQRPPDAGFTLIELMVVVLIIAILIAIAIPTFLGARQRAQDRAAQSNLRNALTAEKSYYTDKQAYTATGTDLSTIEPSLTFDVAVDTAPIAGSIAYATSGTPASTVTLGTKSASGTCFYVRDVVTTGTTYAKNTACDKPSTATGTFSATGWQ
jgi:type IV pilus assembly protein PilA